MVHGILWLSALTQRVFKTYEEAENDAKTHCMLFKKEFNYKKHIKLVFNWIE